MVNLRIRHVAVAAALLPFGEEVFAADVSSNGQKLAYANDLLDETVETVSSARAENRETPVREPERKYARNYFNLGVGVISVPSFNGSKKNNIIPGGLLRGRIKGYSFSTRGTNLSVDILREKRRTRTNVKLGPNLNLRGERSGKLRNAQVSALGKLSRAFEIGGSFGVQRNGIITSKYDQVGAKLTVLHDVSGQHKGLLIASSIDYGTPVSRTTYFGLSAGANWVSKSVGRYYSDVDTAGSAASGLPVYQQAGAKSGFNKYSVGVALVHSLSGDLRKGASLVGGVQYNELLGRYAETPIVRLAGKPSTWSAGMGVAYSF
jgi:MipA family protein